MSLSISKKCFMISIIPFLIFIFWKFYPKQKKKQKYCGVIPGLYNTGNTCFMNTMLQCMASTSMSPWLDKICQLCRIDGRILLAEPLNAIILRLRGSKEEKCFDPSFLLNHLTSSGWYISSEEHDAHEFFHCVLSTLDDEIKYTIKKLADPSLLQFDDHLSSTNSRTPKCSLRLKKALSLFSTHPFNGLLGIRLHCSQCGSNKPVMYESFHSISLPIENCFSGELFDCLKLFFSSEFLKGVQCKTCTKNKRKFPENSRLEKNCNKKNLPVFFFSLENISTAVLTDLKISPSYISKQKQIAEERVETASFTKLTYIAKFPQCFCIHLKRLVWMQGQAVKLYRSIKYPQVLDLTEFKYKCKIKQSIHLNPILMSLIKSRPETGDALLKSRLSSLSQPNRLVGKPSVKNILSHLLLYELTGVIVHFGDWNTNGHFVAYRRLKYTNDCGNAVVQWFYTSDNVVRKCSVNEALNQSAYMLFYERVNSI